MSWFTQTLSSTIGRKVVMALTGFFLISFLVIHALGNTLLFKNDEGEAFNLYAQFMTTSPLIVTASYILYAGIILHIVYSIILVIYNRRARPVGYAVAHPEANSSWKSRNMAFLGTIIFVFLVIHMSNFWYKMKFGTLPTKTYDGVEVSDLYTVVASAFSMWWYSGLYVLSMVALGFHLAHGFWGAFQTVGLNHRKYMPMLKKIGLAFSIIVPLLFASMPIYFFIKSLT